MNLQFPNDPDKVELSFACLRARQPVGELYIATIAYGMLRRMTYFDVRRVIEEERDFERYLGIQRPLIPRRVEQLKKYVRYADASFPTSIIIAIDQDYVRYDEAGHIMTVSNQKEDEFTPSTNIRKIARVLDGQHRIDGLSDFNGPNFDLSVTVFVGSDIADQAQIFATVNLEQTKVNKSLVYDLYELARTRSPQKTCHNIVVALDLDVDGPLHKRIKRLGLATEGRDFEPVTQATFVDGLIRYISADPKADRDNLLRGKKLALVSGELAKSLLFRNSFIEGRDIEITQIVHNFFSAVKFRWPEAWDEQRSGYMLNRTNGIRALLRFLRTAYLDVAQSIGSIPTTNAFLNRLRLVQAEDHQFTTENFAPGTSGEARLVKVLRGEEVVRAQD